MCRTHRRCSETIKAVVLVPALVVAPLCHHVLSVKMKQGSLKNVILYNHLHVNFIM